MTSPTIALLWEIWRQHRSTIAAIALVTASAHVVEFFEAGKEPSPLTVMLAMLAFMLLLGVFNYTESSGDRGLGRFPRRLFTLPVTSLRLVTVPMLAGIVSIELLYLLWSDLLVFEGTTSTPFVAVLLGALMVFYLCSLWMLERVGALRLIVIGLVLVGSFVVGQLPSFHPTPPPLWRSETFLAGLVAGLAIVAFLISWRHVALVRDGDDRSALQLESLFSWITETRSTERRPFASAAAAHFWFEWRSSGVVLPVLVGLYLLLVALPASWQARSDAEDSFRLLLMTLALPMVMAMPVGMAASKATFWSEELGVPAMIAVRPLSSAEFVAIKVRVAALSAVLSWVTVITFLTIWLSVWGNVDSLGLLAIQLWAFHEHSVAAVFGIGFLVVCAGMFLTWRFLVSRLWTGLSGARLMFLGSFISIPVIVMTAIMFEADRLPGWLRADPERLVPVLWIAAIAVMTKYWLAAYAWREVPPRFLREYLLIWFAGTASFLALGLVVLGMVRVYLPLDADRAGGLVVLLALLAIPLARVGLAPASLTRNRHR
jgi:hypothetical protein